jgi:hypothetical protein
MILFKGSPKPKDGEVKITEKFAFLPKQLKIAYSVYDHDGWHYQAIIWLERYVETKLYHRDGQYWHLMKRERYNDAVLNKFAS